MAKQGKYRCQSCGRVFGMAAHLGRHMSTVHAPAGQRKISKVGARSFAGRGQLTGDLERVLGDLRAYRGTLAAQAAALYAQLTSIDQVLALLGGAGAARPAARVGRTPQASGAGTLRDYIERVLAARGGPMPVRDVTAAVVKAGYKSKDKTLAHSVGKYLGNMPNVAKVSRGLFRLK